ncbi:MAG: S-layer homology domain-containing protein, partial [Eubacteriales bacterium]
MKSRSLKKTISILVILVMVFSGPFSSFGASGFSDTSGHWAASSIDKAVSYGFVKGYLDNTFKPDNPVTRAEFSTMLNGALGITNTTSISFSDVPSNEWYYASVRRAVAAGYTGGYEDNTFRPNGKITRQEAAVMISKILPPAQGTTSLSGLGDNGSIADWARTAVMKVFAAGYIKGDNNNLYRPTASLSRA